MVAVVLIIVLVVLLIGVFAARRATEVDDLPNESEADKKDNEVYHA